MSLNASNASVQARRAAKDRVLAAPDRPPAVACNRKLSGVANSMRLRYNADRVGTPNGSSVEGLAVQSGLCVGLGELEALGLHVND